MSNLPTVWSNALVGVALGVRSAGGGPGGCSVLGLPCAAVAIVLIGCSLLYMAGMIHNGVCDVAVDARERPDRPIPSGRVSRRAAGAVAATFIVAGVLLFWLTTWQAIVAVAVLSFLIVTYNVTHHRSAAAVWLMGACRAMVYVAGAAAVTWPMNVREVATCAGLLAIYVIALSLLARAEAGHAPRIRLVVLMICSISLLDAVFLLVLGYPLAAGAAVAWFALAALMQRRILGT